MATVEFHPWNSRRADVERPDEWRIDLDPMPECEFDTRPASGGRRPRGARRARRRRLAEDVRRLGDPHLRPDRAAVGFRRRPPRRAGVRPRGRAPGPGRRDHDLVAQGPGARQGVRRLQPERPRPHDRQRLLGARGPEARVDPDRAGTRSTTSSPRTSRSRPFRSDSPARATCTRASTTRCSRSIRCWNGRSATSARAPQTRDSRRAGER